MKISPLDFKLQLGIDDDIYAAKLKYVDNIVLAISKEKGKLGHADRVSKSNIWVFFTKPTNCNSSVNNQTTVVVPTLRKHVY